MHYEGGGPTDSSVRRIVCLGVSDPRRNLSPCYSHPPVTSTHAQFNVSPSFTLELLDRLAKVFKDYCGVLSEESIRKNFILIYELLDEMIVR